MPSGCFRKLSITVCLIYATSASTQREPPGSGVSGLTDMKVEDDAGEPPPIADLED